MPNYYAVSGEPASGQRATGTDNGPTAAAAETVGATTTGTGEAQAQDNDAQRLHKYKLPYLGLIDRDFDLVQQQPAQVGAQANRQ